MKKFIKFEFSICGRGVIRQGCRRRQTSVVADGGAVCRTESLVDIGVARISSGVHFFRQKS